MNRARGKTFGVAPRIPIFFKTGWSFLPNRLKAALDCQTSITRQPPGIGPAMCASTPLTGQSASRFLRPFKIILTLFSYLARDVAPRNSKRTPMGIGYLQFSKNKDERNYSMVKGIGRVGPKSNDVCFTPKVDIVVLFYAEATTVGPDCKPKSRHSLLSRTQTATARLSSSLSTPRTLMLIRSRLKTSAVLPCTTVFWSARLIF